MGNEVVIASVIFTRPRRPGGARYRKANPGIRAMTRLSRVVLPVPDGAETTNNLPVVIVTPLVGVLQARGFGDVVFGPQRL